MALSTRRWTRADLERLPDDGNKYEVVHGELFVTPYPRPAHAYIQRIIRTHLERHCEAARLDCIVGEMAYVDDDSETIPDLVVYRRIMPPPDKWDFMPTPLLLVEVLSRSTRRRDLGKKRAFYLESGIPEYWIVDGEARRITIVKQGEADRVSEDRVSWGPAGATEPLLLDVRALFREALG